MCKDPESPDPDGPIELRGKCASDQYCVDSFSWTRPQAFCVEQESIFQSAMSQLDASNHISASKVGLPLGGKGSSQYALEAILTNAGGQGVVKAP